jgi:predicted permease
LKKSPCLASDGPAPFFYNGFEDSMRSAIDVLLHSLKSLLRQPGFALVAVTGLALAIGISTAMFSVVNTVLLRPLPYPEPDRLMQLGWTYQDQFFGMDDAQYREIAQALTQIDQVAARSRVSFTLTSTSGSERLAALHVSSGYFSVLGRPPVLGRDFNAGDDQKGAADTVILSDGLWRRRFNADPDVLDRPLSLDGKPYTIIGVLPAGFREIGDTAMYVPLAPAADLLGQGSNYEVIARLGAGATLQGAAQEYEARTKSFLKARNIPENSNVRAVLIPYQQLVARDVRTPLLLLTAAIVLVLLIACANVANLLVARSTMRAKELAVHAALGASRWRLGALVMTESLMIALLGSMLGCVLAVIGVDALLALRSDALPRADEIGVDQQALAFSLALAMLSGFIAGLPAAWQSASGTIVTDLKQSTTLAAPGGSWISRMRSALIVTQVAMALILLVGASLLIKSFSALNRVDPGFDPKPLAAAQYWSTGTQYRSMAEVESLAQSLIRKSLLIPGISHAAVMAAGLPLDRGGNNGVTLRGVDQSPTVSADYRAVSGDVFSTLGIGVLRGRSLQDSDSVESNRVMVINKRFAERHFPGTEALGQQVDMGGRTWEIVGVVANVRSSLSDDAPPTMYVPLAQTSRATHEIFEGWFPTNLIVRSVGSAMNAEALQNVFNEVDRDVPVGRLSTLSEVLALGIAEQNFQARLMTVLAVLALALATLGVYSVLSYVISRGKRDIGIKMALGAGKSQVLATVIRRGLAPVAIGLGFGLGGAIYLTQFLSALLFQVNHLDASAYAAATLALTLVSICACLFPAWRALQVSPIAALRAG